MVPALAYPTHPLRALQLLHKEFPALFPDSTEFPYALIIDRTDHTIHPELARSQSSSSSSSSNRAAGAVEDLNFAVFPSNRKSQVVVGRAPVDETEEAVIRPTPSSTPDPGRDKYRAAGHNQKWRRAEWFNDQGFGGLFDPEDAMSQSDLHINSTSTGSRSRLPPRAVCIVSSLISNPLFSYSLVAFGRFRRPQ